MREGFAVEGGDSWVLYKLAGGYRRLEACVALNDIVNEPWSTSTFMVEGNGKVLWKSKPIGERGKPEQCVVDITGVEQLKLLVHCPGHFHESHAVWLDPMVLK